MEIELSTSAIDAIAYKVALIVEKRLREKQTLPEYFETKIAASMLHISPARLRQIKDKYPHIKTGDSKSSKLLFEAKYLLK